MTVKELIDNKLKCKIDLIRSRMVTTGIAKGLNHPETIKCSQELDEYMNKHYRIKLLQQECRN